MNEKKTPLVFIAIESIWPNSSGTDLGTSYNPDDNSTKNGPGKGNKGTVRQYVQSGDDSPDAVNVGYYLIMPLNVLSANTSTNTSSSGSNNDFSVTFTLDDLILITEDNANSPFLGSSGFLAKANDIVPDLGTGALGPRDFMFFDYLHMSKKGGGTVTEAEYVNYTDLGKGRIEGDSPLGLSRFRVKGGQSMFSIEDLVMPMDTVTIWMYHDPYEFMTPDTFDKGILSNGGNGFSKLREFHHIFGSGDRRKQFITDRGNTNSQLLQDSGLSNEFAANSIKAATKTGAKLSNSSVKNAAIAIAGASAAYIPKGSRSNMASLTIVDTPLDAGESTTDTVAIVAKPDYKGVAIYMSDMLPSAKGTFSYDGTIAGGKGVTGTHTPASKVMEYFIIELHKNQTLLDKDFFSDKGKSAITSLGIDYDKFISGYKILEKDLTKVSAEELTSSADDVSLVGSDLGLSRKMLATKNHCETPYLAMKGHIKNIASDWSANGGYTVTLSGSGLEYPLDRNIPFFNDTIFNGASNQEIISDMTNTYSNIAPPRMIAHLVWRWAPNIVTIGPPSQATTGFKLFLNVDNESEESKVLLAGYAIADTLAGSDVKEGQVQNARAARVFSPLNFIDMNRIAEAGRVYDLTAAGTDLTLSNKNGQISPDTSILSNARSLGSAGNLYELWVDESGKVRYRFTFEAWEKTPDPLYTPTIESTDIIRARFVKGDDEVITLQDVKPWAMNMGSGNGQNVAHARAFPRANKIPFDGTGGSPDSDLISKAAGNTSSALYRYGLRHNMIEDIYGADIESSRPKAYGLLRFFGSPIKKAEITLDNNTSYRAGDTVLINSTRTSHRSNAAINVEYMLGWLKALKGDSKLLSMFVGVDGRLLMLDTTNIAGLKLDTLLLDSNGFKNAPKNFVLDCLIVTFEWLSGIGMKMITPEYFPTTLWFYLKNKGRAFVGPDKTVVPAKSVIRLHEISLKLALQKGNKALMDELVGIYKKYPIAVHSLEFSNYVLRSFYIASVSHGFDYGSAFQTSLSLTHGQDNIGIKDPRSNLLLGFISAERKIKEKYPDPLEEVEVGKVWKRFYYNQWSEDNKFKQSSFMYQAQKYRNSSNYAIKLAQRLNKL